MFISDNANSKNTIGDKLEGFDKGAFYMEELVVRVNNKLRKVNEK